MLAVITEQWMWARITCGAVEDCGRDRLKSTLFQQRSDLSENKVEQLRKYCKDKGIYSITTTTG